MTPAPKWYMPVAVIALLWNLMGCWAYLTNVMMKPEDIAALPAADQAMHAAFPTWAVAAMAVAVWGGALGCVGLIMKKKWAVPLFGASLAGLIIQDIGLYQAASESGSSTATVLGMQAFVLIVAIALLVLGRKARSEGWIA